MTGPSTTSAFARRHLRFGWWALAAFATLGLLLEAFHGFKARMYLDVSNDTRRLTWTLAHAHGTLLAVVNIVFGLVLNAWPDFSVRRLRLISGSLLGASLLLPGGFFLGGVSFYSGDPGLGVLLVPAGAVLFIGSIVMIAQELGALGKGREKSPGQGRNR